VTTNIHKFPSPSGLLALSDLPEREPLKPWYPGFPGWRGKLAFAAGTLVVATGHPGHGKSSLIGQIVFNLARNHDLGVVVATFENHPMPSYRKLIRQFHAGTRQANMQPEEIAAADKFLDDHYRFVIHPKERPTLEWLLDQAAKAIDFSILIIDPWNRLESQRRKDETETEYIAWCLSELRQFAVTHDCAVFVISHPAKRDPRFRDRVPFLEDISGSKHWDNMPDQGLVIHRENFWNKDSGARQWNADLYHLKARYEELGYPCHLKVKLNSATWRFEEVSG
jgi:twinkle protein